MLRASLGLIAAAFAASAVTGSGTVRFGNSVEQISVRTSGSSGRAEFVDRTASGTVTGTIQINCVRVVGNEATLSGIVTRTNRPSIRGFEALFQIRDIGGRRGERDNDRARRERDDDRRGRSDHRDDKDKDRDIDKDTDKNKDKDKDKDKDRDQDEDRDRDNRGRGNARNTGPDMASTILFHAVGTGSNCQVPGEFDLVPVRGDFSVRP